MFTINLKKSNGLTEHFTGQIFPDVESAFSMATGFVDCCGYVSAAVIDSNGQPVKLYKKGH